MTTRVELLTLARKIVINDHNQNLERLINKYDELRDYLLFQCDLLQKQTQMIKDSITMDDRSPSLDNVSLLMNSHIVAMTATEINRLLVDTAVEIQAVGFQIQY